MKNKKISLKNLDLLVFDFDGVLTNNKVFINSEGKEWVECDRSDGLAFDVLKKLKVKTFIFSSEENNVVTARAKKLKIPVIQNIKEKDRSLKTLIKEQETDFSRVFYVGNDLNDYKAMKLCGFSACPSDSHIDIQNIATFKLKSKGGNGVVRELVESLFNIDFVDILYE
ncbi:MAG: HAD hydrolase family protein [Pseudomonadota bacterium]|nr:HAD hydrolase family protein [Pseudomonadota bacterium]